MKKISLLTIFLLSHIYTTAQTDIAKTLAGVTNKAWVLNSRTPEKKGATCKTNHPIFLDNTYTFYTDGKFEFNHGQVTEDENCDEACCGDVVNLTGNWKFANSGKGIVIKAEYKKDDPSQLLEITLFSVP